MKNDPNRQHDHHEGHEHSSGHSHSHAPASYGVAFAVGISLNIVFVLVEAGYGYYANSLALLSDAGHNLSDVLGLVLAWGAIQLAKRAPSGRFTYGLRSASILISLTNALLLLIAVGGIIYEAVERFGQPANVQAGTVMVVATIGILINGITAYLFLAGSKKDLNIRGAYMHMAADTIVSAGVVVAGFIILQTGFSWIDPVVSVVIGVVILISTWSLLKDSVALALSGVPRNIDLDRLKQFLLSTSGVKSVHDLHVWALSTSQNAMTAHVVCDNDRLDNAYLFNLSKAIEDEFTIHHVTLQFENADQINHACPLEMNRCL